ncbi:ORF165 [Saltwater crocodilepox virus]|nr:ORF165 [Saltwater crocodilepox virus]
MEKFRRVYQTFFEISRLHLERSGERTADPDPESDVQTLVSALAAAEGRLGRRIDADLPDDDVVRCMKMISYRVLSFWFLRSPAVVKSVYKSLPEAERGRFLALFRDLLVAAQTIGNLNALYSNIKQDASEIIDDSKKLLEIMQKVKAASNDNQAFSVLNANATFISTLINHALSDENYLVKIIAIFYDDLVTDREKLEFYKEIFSLSTENVLDAVGHLMRLEVGSRVDAPSQNSRYVKFFKKILCKVSILQNHNIDSHALLVKVLRLYAVVRDEITSNDELIALGRGALDEFRAKLDLDDLKQERISSLRSMLGYINSNRSFYRDVVVETFRKFQAESTRILRGVIARHALKYDGRAVDLDAFVSVVYDKYVRRLVEESPEESEEAVRELRERLAAWPPGSREQCRDAGAEAAAPKKKGGTEPGHHHTPPQRGRPLSRGRGKAISDSESDGGSSAEEVCSSCERRRRLSSFSSSSSSSASRASFSSPSSSSSVSSSPRSGSDASPVRVFVDAVVESETSV